MNSATELMRRIRRTAAAGPGLRFTPDQADLLRAVLDLSQADVQAQALDKDDQLFDRTAQPGMRDTEAAR